MKLVLSLVIIACAVHLNSSVSHDLVIGQPRFGDVIVFKTNECKYGFPLFVRTTEVTYPEWQLTNAPIINAIFVKDHYTNGDGGYATVLAGGIGQKFVKLKLKSQRGSGFNFTVTVFGRF